MTLHADAQVPHNVRRVINNAFYEHHPFKSGSGQLSDFVAIIGDVRALAPKDLGYCLEAVERLLAKCREIECVGCTGKGLAFLKVLALGVDDAKCGAYSRSYKDFCALRDWERDFESELREEIEGSENSEN